MFVGIGAQKAGTSWLADYFQKHDEVLMSPLKELHYFDRFYAEKTYRGFTERFKKALESTVKRVTPEDTAENRALLEKCDLLLRRLKMGVDPDAFLDYFRSLYRGEKIFGEISPSYSVLDRRAFEEMRKIHPEVRIIFIMRNPVDRYWSHLRFRIQQNPEFDPVKQFERKLSVPMYFERTDYRKTVNELEAVFNKEEILYLFYEHLFAKEARQADRELEKVCDFFGISRRPAEREKVVRKSKGISLDPELRKKGIRHFLPVYEFVRERFGEETPRSWIEDMENL